MHRTTRATLFPYTTLFRSSLLRGSARRVLHATGRRHVARARHGAPCARAAGAGRNRSRLRSEEHTSELQSPCNLVCRLLLEKKKTKNSKLAQKQPRKDGRH